MIYLAFTSMFVAGMILFVVGLFKKNLLKYFGIVLVFWGMVSFFIYISLPEQNSSRYEKQEVDTSVSFEQIYQTYEENEIRADDVYKGNRYRVEATINGIRSGFFSGENLTLEKRIGNTIVFFHANFRDRDSIKSFNVGDDITFDGTCVNSGSWNDCEVVE